MKLKFEIILLAGLVAGGAQSQEIITSPDQIEEIVYATQERFWQVVPPMDDPLYVHRDRLVRFVDWKSTAWPKSFIEQVYAEMENINGLMYPFYRLSVVETRIGEIVYYNSFDREIWRTLAPSDYNEYLFAFLYWNVDSVEQLTTEQLKHGRSSNVGLEILLLPESFIESYRLNVVMDTRPELLMAQGAASALNAPAMAMEGGGGGAVANMSAGSNGVVTLNISPSNGCRYLEIFRKSDLVNDPSWSIATEWLATFGGTVYWTDPASSNETQGFFLIGNAEIDTDGGDGRSDLHEEITGSDPAVFNSIDSDGDGLHDWWETRLFGDLSQTGTNDYDGDYLLNNEELIWSGTEVVLMHSDPSLSDSDNEGLDDYKERREWFTDPMDPDTDSDELDDATEVLGSPRTDPHNPDVVAPVLMLAGD